MPATEIKVDAQEVVALKLHQWLENWNHFSSVKREPELLGRDIYIFSMKARDLRILSDVFRRQREGDSAEGIQRRRDMSRTGRTASQARRKNCEHYRVGRILFANYRIYTRLPGVFQVIWIVLCD